MPNVGVVGGGMLGLSLALRLRQRGYDVTVFEAAPIPGALSAPATIGTYSWDHFPHDIHLSDHHLRGLLQEIGIADRLRWGVARTGCHAGGKVHSLSSALDVLRYPVLSPFEKARLGLTVARAANVLAAESLEGRAAAEWLCRWSGTSAYERLWLPLLKARLGENHALANAAFACEVVKRIYAARHIGHKREMSGYVQGGYAAIPKALCAHLAELATRLEIGVPVARVIDDHESATVLLQDGRSATFDHVVVTTPAPVTALLCPQLTDAERARLERVTYQGVVCLSVLLRRPLGGFYVTNIAGQGMPFNAVVEMTAFVPPATFGGNTLVYLPRNLAQDDSYWSLSDATIRTRFLLALGTMYPTLAQRDVIAWEIARVRHVLALPTLHYARDAMPAVETSRPRIHLVNSAQIAFPSLNANDTIALANAQAERLHLRLVGAGENNPPPSALATTSSARAL